MFLCVTMHAAENSPDGDLQGFWRLDEGTGEVVNDASTYGRHGKVAHCCWGRTRDGKASALEFNGLLSYVDISGKEYQFSDEVTLAAWVNPSDLSSEGAFVSLGREHPSCGYHFLHGPNGTLHLLIASEKRPRVGDAVFRLSTKPVLQLGKWTHVAAAYSAISDKAAIYVDGKLVACSKTEGKLVYYAVWDVRYPPLTIGDRSHQKPYWSFDGFIRNVRIYSRYLPTEEVRSIYEAEAPQVTTLAVTPSRMTMHQMPCRLTVNIVDAQTGQLTPAKMLVADADGNCYYPPEAYDRGLAYGLLEKRKAFYSDGVTTVPLTEDNYTLQITKGYEYLPATVAVKMAHGEQKHLRMELRRLVDMRALGWFSGEHHMHCVGHGVQKYDRIFGDTKSCLPTLLLILRAEGFHYAYVIPAGVRFGETRTESDFMLHASSEWGSGGTGGDICLIGFRTPPKRRSIFDNLAAFATAHQNRWVALHTHPDWGKVSNPKDLGFARDLPIVVAYGWSPVWDLFCWSASEEKLRWWYRWLNLGFRLAITGSTDTYFNNPRHIISPGSNRTYVRANTLTPDAILDGYRHGRTFATTGPLLILQAQVGEQAPWAEVGDVIRLKGDEPTRLQVRLRCWSGKKLARMELIRNGEVVWTKHGDGSESQEHLIALTIEGTSWLAARCYEEGAKDMRSGFAHTSPIYVQFGNEPVKTNEDDVAFFVRWLDEYEKVLPAIAQDIRGVTDYTDLLQHIRNARAIYVGLREKPRRWVE